MLRGACGQDAARLHEGQRDPGRLAEATNHLDARLRQAGERLVGLDQLVESGGARRGLRSRGEPVQHDDPTRAVGGKLIADAQPEGSGADDDGIGLGDGKRTLHAALSRRERRRGGIPAQAVARSGAA